MAAMPLDPDREYHESLVSNSPPQNGQQNVHKEEIRTTPLFSADVLKQNRDVLIQYSFLAKVLATLGGNDPQILDEDQTPGSDKSGVALNPDGKSFTNEAADSRLFVNMRTPWSAFICGSQGSGKSHTLSCMLEAALQHSGLGKLPSPLAGVSYLSCPIIPLSIM